MKFKLIESTDKRCVYRINKRVITIVRDQYLTWLSASMDGGPSVELTDEHGSVEKVYGLLIAVAA